MRRKYGLASLCVKPKNWMPKIGKAQGIAFNTKPPSKAPSSARLKIQGPEETAAEGVLDGVPSALGNAWADEAGQPPATGKATSTPCLNRPSPETKSHEISCGLPVRLVLTGNRNDNTLPCQCWLAFGCWFVEDSKSSGFSGKTDTFSPTHLGGNPCKVLTKKAPSNFAGFLRREKFSGLLCQKPTKSTRMGYETALRWQLE